MYLGRFEWYLMIEIQSVELSKSEVTAGEAVLIKVQVQEVFAIWNDLVAKTWGDVNNRTWEDLKRKII